MIQITLTAATEEELQKKYEQYCNEYHPIGYGTGMDGRPKQLEDGTWMVKVSRSESCD